MCSFLIGKTNRFVAAGLALLLAGAPGPACAQGSGRTRYDTTDFSATYTANGTSYGIQGRMPAASGKFPVFVYIGGTYEGYQGHWAEAAVEAAAQRGLIAASVEYPNREFGDCSVISGRAKGIFDSSSADSAIAKLCAMPNADCSKGVVTGGLSQGSIISVLSRNFDSRVRASFGQGTGTTYTRYYDLTSCIADGNHAQKGRNLRIINGEHDMFVGGSLAIAGSQAATVTGLTCSSNSQSCFLPNGSGWYVVRDNQVKDYYADHCFMGYGGYPGNQCFGLYVDSNYASGTEGWEINPTLDWLTTFVGSNIGSTQDASN